jgi:hypothetical protein
MSSVHDTLTALLVISIPEQYHFVAGAYQGSVLFRLELATDSHLQQE